MLMYNATGLSQRHACRLAGLSLSTCRYDVQRPAVDEYLSDASLMLALERRSFGTVLSGIYCAVKGFMLITSGVPPLPSERWV